MTPIEKAISNLAGRWLELRERARTHGGGLLYWLFGFLGLVLMAQIGINVAERHFKLTFPWVLVVPCVFALIWVRTSAYRLRPFRMFGVTFLLLVILAEMGWITT